LVEKALGVSGDNILYVGDHIYTDAALAKLNFRSAAIGSFCGPGLAGSPVGLHMLGSL
jgi:hypothetical protein